MRAPVVSLLTIGSGVHMKWIPGQPRETGWYWVAWGTGERFARTIEFWNGEGSKWHVRGEHRTDDIRKPLGVAHIGPLDEPEERL